MDSQADNDCGAGPKCWNSAKFQFSALNKGLYDLPLTTFILYNKLYLINLYVHKKASLNFARYTTICLMYLWRAVVWVP